MVIRSRWMHLTTALAAALGLTALAVVSSASHEQDEPPAAPNGVFTGPARGESVGMPRGLIGLTITLGLQDEARTPWNGEVAVSEGRVLGLNVIQGAPNASSVARHGRDRSGYRCLAASHRRRRPGARLGRLGPTGRGRLGDLRPNMDNGKLMIPAAGAEPNFGPIADRNKSVPRLGFAGDGTLWMLVRHHPLPGGQGEVWVGSALAFNGETWSPPIRLAHSAKLFDNRPALAAVGKELLAVYSSDLRQNANNRGEDDLYAARLSSSTAPAVGPNLIDDPPAPLPSLPMVHGEEASDIRKIRDYRVNLGDKTLRPLRGEFHRHTEISSHNDQYGLLEDAWRYALDAANHDWMGNGDHDNGGREDWRRRA